jgi:integrase
MKHNDYHYIYNSIFATDIDEYVLLKRATGLYFKGEAAVLRQFDRFCIEKNISKLAIDQSFIVEWLSPRLNEKTSTRTGRISTLKGFIEFMNRKYCNIIVWPPIFRYCTNTEEFVPYIFTHKEIASIFKAANELPIVPRTQFNIIFPAILRVMYGCGLRISETLSLQNQDVDLITGVLTVRHSKFDNNRLVPISKSLQEYLTQYKIALKCSSTCQFFFPNQKELPYSTRTVYDKFRSVLWAAGISHGGRGKGPRVHDLRHTFAVHSLQKCEQNGIDTYVFLPILSAYLGHAQTTTTEKYLRLISESFPNLLHKAETISNSVIPEVQIR